MEEQRRLLDALLGPDRNSIPTPTKRPEGKKFSDPDICKYYLCGLCPFEELQGTVRKPEKKKKRKKVVPFAHTSFTLVSHLVQNQTTITTITERIYR